MLKPTANYKMSSSDKRYLATITDPHKRGAVKQVIIQGDLYSALQPRREKKPRSSFPQDAAVEE